MIICATGHRPNALGGYGKEVAHNLFKFAKHKLSELDPKKVISGMALGWDQAVAKASSDLGIQWMAAIPFKGQELAWPDKAQKEYRDLLKSASSVKVVSEGAYSARKMQIRNEWMVDNSTMVLAIWNGSFGGTYNCLMYATSIGRDITNVWWDWVKWSEAGKGSANGSS